MKGSYMRNMKMLVSFALLGLGTLLGCGGVEAVDPPPEGVLQSVEQSLCESPPPTQYCLEGTMRAVSCNYNGIDVLYTCQKIHNGKLLCLLWSCNVHNMWGTNTTSGDCSNTCP